MTMQAAGAEVPFERALRTLGRTETSGTATSHQ